MLKEQFNCVKLEQILITYTFIFVCIRGFVPFWHLNKTCHIFWTFYKHVCNVRDAVDVFWGTVWTSRASVRPQNNNNKNQFTVQPRLKEMMSAGRVSTQLQNYRTTGFVHVDICTRRVVSRSRRRSHQEAESSKTTRLDVCQDAWRHLELFITRSRTVSIQTMMFSDPDQVLSLNRTRTNVKIEFCLAETNSVNIHSGDCTVQFWKDHLVLG